MLDKIFQLDVPALNLIFRGVAVYLSVLILLRISGKKQIGQMGATEFVAILLISNAVQNAMNGGDNSLTGGLILAVVLIVTSAAISYLTYKSSAMSSIFEGTPTLLIHNGKMIHKNLAHEQIRESELKVMLRKQDVHQIDDVHTAILEADGTFSITKKTEKT